MSTPSTPLPPVPDLDGDDQTIELPLSGGVAADCGLCAARLRDTVRQRPGVTDVRVVSSSGTLAVSFDPDETTADAVTEAAHREHGSLAERFRHQTYAVAGMDCAHCAEGLEQMARQVPGVVSATVQYSAGKMRVEYAGNHAENTSIENAPNLLTTRARGMGFTLSSGDTVAATAGTAAPNWREKLSGNGARAGLAVGFLALGLLLEHVVHAPETVSRVAYGVSLLVGGWRFAQTGLAALKQRVIGTNLLMAVAAIGALFIGAWEEAAMVISLYAVGVALEGAAMDRTRRSLRELVDARPLEAVYRCESGHEHTIPAAKLEVGDLMVIKPGASVPADGVIVEGTSAVAEAAITGESVPAEKAVGANVYAGSVNGHGTLLVRVSALAQNSTLARLLHLVEEAQAQKAPTQAVVERFGRVYTPLVLGGALLLGLVGPLVFPGVNWTYRALTLLVVACPCALVIATPVAYVSAIARAAKAGVLVKGGAYLEALAEARQFFFDKTGTLTRGELRVSDIVTDDGVSETQLLTVAGGAEMASEHPVARAVVHAVNERGLLVRAATNAKAVPGRGLVAEIGKQPVVVGTAVLLEMHAITRPAALVTREAELANQGKTTLWVAHGGRVLGVVAVADQVRAESAAALADLQTVGASAAMLTGDNKAVAQTVGKAVGVSDIHAALLPEDKLNLVRSAAQQGGVVFVGDGINDAPALAAASVGVAMGHGGTAAALEAADLALMRNDLRLLPWAARLARQTRQIVRTNIALSVGAVVLLLLATLSGHLSLPLGVLGHEGSALLVILNGVRLLSPRTTPKVPGV